VINNPFDISCISLPLVIRGWPPRWLTLTMMMMMMPTDHQVNIYNRSQYSGGLTYSYLVTAAPLVTSGSD
jgi:hypothetical protein